MKKGTIRARGIRTPLPVGHIWGRSDHAQGDAHPIKVGDGLAIKNGVVSATAGTTGATTAYNGFGFFFVNPLTANQLIGGGVFDRAITFPSVSKPASVVCIVPPAADAVLHVIDPLNAVIATITILAGTLTGTIVWTPASYTLAANTIIRLLAPASPDATLSLVSGFVPGDFA